MVVAQLVERLLPTPEFRSSNPAIDEFLYRSFVNLLSTILKRPKNGKRGRDGPIFKEPWRGALASWDEAVSV